MERAESTDAMDAATRRRRFSLTHSQTVTGTSSSQVESNSSSFEPEENEVLLLQDFSQGDSCLSMTRHTSLENSDHEDTNKRGSFDESS